MRTERLAIVVLVVFAGMLPRSASAQIYTWRDAQGHLVLSDRPAGQAAAYDGPTPGSGSIRTTRPTSGRGDAYDGLIEEHASSQGISPELVRAVIQVESGFNPRAVSAKGAMGLMQLMPATVTQYGVVNPFDPADNIRAGVAYLRRLLDRYSNRVELALAAYNAGPGAVDRHGERVPPYKETRDYVRRITSVTPIQLGPKRVIYKIVELIDGREVPRYSDRRPTGRFEVVGRHARP